MENYKRIISGSLLSLGLLGTSCNKNYTDTPQNEVKQSKEISLAPDFEYKTLEGKTISLKDSENRLLVLEWWTARCQPCIEQIPENNKVYERFGNRNDFFFLGINGNYASDVEGKEEGKKAMIEWLKDYKKENNILYDIASDPKWEDGIKQRFNISGRPVTILIKNREIKATFKGKPEDGVLEKTIEDLLD